ncbi:MAG: hypothetical protein IGR76_15920 [Synechococcales cyanobacterium T60_A2020_003]|nr:hypothetical protein [Synechococcales cyanobacterium T60_A2020_003]
MTKVTAFEALVWRSVTELPNLGLAIDTPKPPSPVLSLQATNLSYDA